MFQVIRQTFLVVLNWLRIFFLSFFKLNTNEAPLANLLPLIFIGFAIVIFMMIIKLIRNTTWGG